MSPRGQGKTRRHRARPGSLLAAEASGGIAAAQGFDFQTRYAVCHLPLWLVQKGFAQLLLEGTGDIDVRFTIGDASRRVHIQVKDHEVSPAELKAVVEQFQRSDLGMPGVYERFTLACPSLSSTLRPIEAGLARLRGAQPFYDDAPGALAPSEQDLADRLRKAGLAEAADFIRASVFLDVGHGDLRYDDRALELFIVRLLDHPEYSGRVRAVVQPAFAHVMRAISARRGQALDLAEIEGIMRASVLAGAPERPGVTVWIHNWARETFDRLADHTLDWSPYFDRSTRRVPSIAQWRDELLPALHTLRKDIASNRPERLIRFRGKCALSTGVALGATFPVVGGWVFEVPQPPAQDDWRSDAVPTAGYRLLQDTTELDPGGVDLIVGLNIKGDARDDVTRYVERIGLRPRFHAFMSPATQGSQAIAGSEDACAFALAVRETLGDLVKKHGIARVHLFYYGPLALAIFLGQRMTSMGELHLYEYQDPGYVPSCILRT